MEATNVFVNRDNTAIIVCPICGFSRILSSDKFQGQKTTLKVKCPSCKSVFEIVIERRKANRKQVYFDAVYSPISAKKDAGNILIKDISTSGIGFTSPDTHKIKLGDKLKVKFSLNTAIRSEIVKAVVVKSIRGEFVGCEFLSSDKNNNALKFHLCD